MNWRAPRGRPTIAPRPVSAPALLVLAGALLLAGCGGPKPAPAAPVPAGPTTINLSGWKLSIPVENNKGHATLLEPAYTVTPWMVPDSTGALEFWAPANGATTANSEHPRTELDSLTTFEAGRSARTLRASVTLEQVPQDGQGIILGQIHGADDISSVPYVMLRYQNGAVRVVVKQVQDGDDLINYPLLDAVSLGQRFDFSITDQGNGSMLFTSTRDGVTQRVTAPVPAEFAGATVRFQVGDYQQSDKPGDAQDGGRVVFHEIVESPGSA